MCTFKKLLKKEIKRDFFSNEKFYQGRFTAILKEESQVCKGDNVEQVPKGGSQLK